MENTKWYVWSNEHNSWWAAGHRGYTNDHDERGLYSYREALEIVKGANNYIANGQPPNEAMILAVEIPLQNKPTVLAGKTAIQKFANWLALKDGVENFEVAASDTAFTIRRTEAPVTPPGSDRPINNERE